MYSPIASLRSMNTKLYIFPFARHYSGNRFPTEVGIAFFSTCYWDVSLRMVPVHIYPTVYRHAFFKCIGFPIRTPPDQSFIASSPRHFAGLHVLHRLTVPRHPPYTLICFSSLTNLRTVSMLFWMNQNIHWDSWPITSLFFCAARSTY